MPRPNREARIQRIVAALDIYDQMSDGLYLTTAEVAEALRINHADASLIRRHIQTRVRGERQPIDFRPKAKPTGTLPAEPEKLTPMETRIYRVLVDGSGMALSGAEIYALATGISLEVSSSTAVVAHIANMRAKGCRIASRKGEGYWLEPVEDVAS